MEYSKKDTVERITRILDEHYMKGPDFARTFGVSHSLLSDWKRGKAGPGVEILMKISEYFHVSMDYLAKGTPIASDSIGLKLQAKKEKELLEKYHSLPEEYKASTEKYIDSLYTAYHGIPVGVEREKNAG